VTVAALLMAAGTGSRFGGPTPKQFLPLAGKPVIRYAAEGLAPHVDLLLPVGEAAPIADALAGLAHLPPVAGGATRQESVRLGLEVLAPHQPSVVLVHDAARPRMPSGLVADLLAKLADVPGAIPAIPVADTLKRVEHGEIVATVPRAGLQRAQTPQAFRFAVLLEAHRRFAGEAMTDDAALLEAAGETVAVVAGDEGNVKITLSGDLARVERAMLGALLPRTGTGFDVHAFFPAEAPGRKLMLCGVEVPHPRGLAGHSDADVGIHALCDAIYGALAEGDIGRHFPPSEAVWKDADSARFLVHAAARIAAAGGMLANADVTLICERPKIAPYAVAMEARLADLLGVPARRVSVKATTTERLGFAGRGEGIAAQAVATILLDAAGFLAADQPA
jgi:2-C-methyl-D-erythritol 4-phosphate cytidylyltransferase/2-C-methyl-D-erythritol 2,4-cyclodiphosphate synthase